MVHLDSRRERGAAAVEFALILPLMLLLVGGIVDFGRFFYTQNIVVNAAREGARSRALGYSTAASTTVTSTIATEPSRRPVKHSFQIGLLNKFNASQSWQA